jgi:hypothetical protein
LKERGGLVAAASDNGVEIHVTIDFKGSQSHRDGGEPLQ